MKQIMCRRSFLRTAGAASGAVVLAACTPKAPQVVIQTKEVVKEVVVTATPAKRDKIQLLYWVVAGGVRDKLYGDSVEAFNAKNGPALTVKMEPLVGNDEAVQ